MIDLYLSSDGKHTVHVSADSPEQLSTLAPHAMRLYETVLQSYGTKAEMWHEVVNGKTNGDKPKTGLQIAAPQTSGQTEAPRCPMHDRPMVYQEGKFGAFWSCHVRKPDGRWCSVTKDASKDEEMPSAVA